MMCNISFYNLMLTFLYYLNSYFSIVGSRKISSRQFIQISLINLFLILHILCVT